MVVWSCLSWRLKRIAAEPPKLTSVKFDQNLSISAVSTKGTDGESVQHMFHARKEYWCT